MVGLIQIAPLSHYRSTCGLGFRCVLWAEVRDRAFIYARSESREELLDVVVAKVNIWVRCTGFREAEESCCFNCGGGV